MAWKHAIAESSKFCTNKRGCGTSRWTLMRQNQRRRDKTNQMLNQIQLPRRSLCWLSATASVTIARFCINTKASYLARVTDVFEMREQFDRLNTYMGSLVRDIIVADLGLGAVSPRDLQEIRNLTRNPVTSTSTPSMARFELIRETVRRVVK
jgi:hypothetical protein